jgi:hypothetical protein
MCGKSFKGKLTTVGVNVSSLTTIRTLKDIAIREGVCESDIRSAIANAAEKEEDVKGAIKQAIIELIEAKRLDQQKETGTAKVVADGEATPAPVDPLVKAFLARLRVILDESSTGMTINPQRKSANAIKARGAYRNNAKGNSQAEALLWLDAIYIHNIISLAEVNTLNKLGRVARVARSSLCDVRCHLSPSRDLVLEAPHLDGLDTLTFVRRLSNDA